MAGCPLCQTDGGLLVFGNQQFRVVQAEESGFPAFYRVIWNAHVAEFSDLSPEERSSCMNTVVAVERVLREQLQPCKINLAALGNVVPHLHWHVIARFDWDTHFPLPVWGNAQRPQAAQKLAQVAHKCFAANLAIAQVLTTSN